MTVKDFLNMYKKSYLYDVVIEINYGGCGSFYNEYSKISQDDLEREVGNFLLETNLLIINVKDSDTFNSDFIGENTEKVFLSQIKGKEPKEIISTMKEFFSDCKINSKSDDVKKYASFLYCKDNKLI